MKNQWASMSPRERMLVITAGILVVVFGFYMGLVRPLIAFSMEQQRAHHNAMAVYVNVMSGIKTAKYLKANVRGAEKQDNGQSLRVVVSIAARQTGVVISRIQPSDTGGLTIWVEGTSAQSLFGWLDKLDSENGIVPMKASIQKSGTAGNLRAQIQFYENL